MAASANELKDQGNKCFIARKYNDAVSLYTKAIVRISNSKYSTQGVQSGISTHFDRYIPKISQGWTPPQRLAHR